MNWHSGGTVRTLGLSQKSSGLDFSAFYSTNTKKNVSEFILWSFCWCVVYSLSSFELRERVSYIVKAIMKRLLLISSKSFTCFYLPVSVFAGSHSNKLLYTLNLAINSLLLFDFRCFGFLQTVFS